MTYWSGNRDQLLPIIGCPCNYKEELEQTKTPRAKRTKVTIGAFITIVTKQLLQDNSFCKDQLKKL